MHSSNMNFESILVDIKADICTVQINRPLASNTINHALIEDLQQIVNYCESPEQQIKIFVLKGLPDVFCSGGDFLEVKTAIQKGNPLSDPEPLYNLWLSLVHASFISICVVQGKVNAGGVGFVCASDIVIADHSANFGFSEMLFGLYPACVMPFLMRRTGLQRAHYMTLMTRSFTAQEAFDYKIVDAIGDSVDIILRTHLIRLQRLNKTAITNYKSYLNTLNNDLTHFKQPALTANRAMFNHPENIRNITRYVEEFKFPWEG
jgi:polyketide biosynthesis enoyl-CoA hydratase PksH